MLAHLHNPQLEARLEFPPFLLLPPSRPPPFPGSGGRGTRWAGLRRQETHENKCHVAENECALPNQCRNIVETFPSRGECGDEGGGAHEASPALFPFLLRLLLDLLLR